MEILLEQTPRTKVGNSLGGSLELLNDLKVNYPKKVEIKYFIKPVSCHSLFLELGRSRCNFSIFDDDMFRFEYEPKGYKAYASFKEVGKVRELRRVFDKYFRGKGVIGY